MAIKVAIDAGHCSNTAGKRTPDVYSFGICIVSGLASNGVNQVYKQI